ncbi:MAG: S-adenosyl-l-methionine hydroxide adenosyltransferase family protein [Halobacteria archaeon]
MVVTLLTDFDDFYVGAMKGVLHGITDAEVVDIYHDLPRQDVRSAAFALLNTAPWFPDGSVHCIVVDPGVGTDRKAVAVVVDGGRQTIVAPDNGVALPAARKMGEYEVHEVRYESPESSTFHGRDVFAPAAAEIAEGKPVYEEEPIDDYVDLEFGTAIRTSSGFSAEVLYVDSFGNAVTNLEGGRLLEAADFGETLRVNGREIPFQDTYARVDEGGLLGTIGSHDNFEVSVNRGSATELMDIDTEDRLEIEV